MSEAGSPRVEDEEASPRQDEQSNEHLQPENQDESELSELSELSDLDEEQFEEAPLDDDEVYKMKSHKRKGASAGSKGTTKPKIRQPRRPRGGTLPDDDDDEREYNTESNQKARKSGGNRRSKSVENEVEIDLDSLSPEERARVELERKLDAALKPTHKRRKLDGDDIEMMQDEAISNLRQQMKDAAMKDRACIDKGEPAIYKVEMLPQVRAVLQKQNLADSILDNNLLEAVRMWLEPLPDASLPSYEIQNDLFAALERLPIKTIHLRESSLGKVVLFYKKSTRPQIQVKRTAERLIGKWTRPIMGRSDNYRDKAVITRNYNPTEQLLAGATGTGDRGASGANDPESLAELAARRRNRAAIPSSRAVTFDVAPQSSVVFNQQQQQRQMDDQYKRIKQKLAANRSVKGKKSGVSIEGKELRS